ncbi:MAG: hypothetical protein NC111_00700 [Bacteroides sp.]|nr:hypothetical protein [Bacteroides sp.]MCM1413854.1 hypothetical protein [Bacteroides sp.]MCM1471037.1 hypothetical protein [Bacteroides sp.]
MKTANKLKTLAAMIALTIASTLTLTSCVDNDDDNGYGGDISGVTALVTFQGTVASPTADGSIQRISTFTYYPVGNGQPSTFTAVGAVDSDIQIGRRCILEYIPVDYSNPTASGNVTLIRCRPIATSEVQLVDAATAQAANAPIALARTGGNWEINRTGYYINLIANMPVYSDRKFLIYADESTVDTQTVELYLTTEAEGEPTGVTQSVMGSIDITQVWRNANVERVNIHINNSTLSNAQSVFTFEK